MIKIDGSILIQIINFLFLVFALNVVLYKPIRNILRKRKANIDDLNSSIGDFEDQAQAKDNAYKTGIRDARVKGLKEKDRFIENAREEERVIIDDINQRAQAELAKVREKIAQEAQDVKASLEKEVDKFAGAIGEKILGRAVS
jgi:F-type H+-transporting ATPase subunit b